MSPRSVLQLNLSRFTNRKWTSSLVFNIRICQKPPNSSLIICCYVTDSVWWNVLREHTGNCSLVLRGNQRWYLRRQPDIKYDRYDCCHSLMIHSCRECPCHDNCTTPCNKLVTAGFIYSYTYHWHCVELFHQLLYTNPPITPPAQKNYKTVQPPSYNKQFSPFFNGRQTSEHPVWQRHFKDVCDICTGGYAATVGSA